nr:hypothetical protein CFP56_73505 [Quercus suber]
MTAAMHRCAPGCSAALLPESIVSPSDETRSYFYSSTDCIKWLFLSLTVNVEMITSTVKKERFNNIYGTCDLTSAGKILISSCQVIKTGKQITYRNAAFDQMKPNNRIPLDLTTVLRLQSGLYEGDVTQLSASFYYNNHGCLPRPSYTALINSNTWLVVCYDRIYLRTQRSILDELVRMLSQGCLGDDCGCRGASQQYAARLIAAIAARL